MTHGGTQFAFPFHSNSVTRTRVTVAVRESEGSSWRSTSRVGRSGRSTSRTGITSQGRFDAWCDCRTGGIPDQVSTSLPVMSAIKVGQPIRRHTARPSHQQTPVQQGLPDEPALPPPTRVNLQRPPDHRQPSDPPQFPSQHHVVHQWNLGKATDGFEAVPSDEHPLVTVRHLAAAGSPRIPSLQPPKQPTTGINRLAKGASHHARVVQGLLNLFSCVDRQPAIGVQEQQHVPTCCSGPRILLKGPSRPTRNQPCASLHGKSTRFVAASTIDNDHFNRASRPG